MPIKHHDQSGASDSGAPGVIEPSHWNKAHDLTGFLAAIDPLAVQPNSVLYFNASSAALLAQISTFVVGILNSANGPAFLTAIGAAGLASPALTGNPTAPNQALGDNSLKIANTAFVASALAALVNSSPAALDTLKELADAIGDDANFSVTMTTALGNRLRFDAAQTLTSGQKTQAGTNLGLGTAAPLNVGTGANQIVQLNGSSKLPAIDGSLLTNLPGLPAGLPAWFPANAAPSGWLALNGSLISRVTYAALWTFANGSGNIVADGSWSPGNTGAFSTGDLSTTFRLPDLRGEFIRGWDNGRGIDSGRGIGTWQADAMQGHWHSATGSGNTGTSAFSGAGAIRSDGSQGSTIGLAISVGSPITDGSNGTPRTAAETRSRNVAWLPCIKY